MAAAALLPALAMLVFNQVSSRYQRNAELHLQASAAARQASSEVDRILEGMRTLLVTAAAIPVVADRTAPECAEALKRLASQIESIRTIVVLDTSGKLICDSLGSKIGTDFSDRAYFRDALHANDMVVGGYTRSKLSGAQVLPVAMPLKNGNATTGVIVTGIRLEWLGARLEERGMVDGGAVTIADREGMILARNPLPERFVGTKIPDAFRHLLTAPQSGTLEVVSQDGTTRILGYEPVNAVRPLYVSAGLSKDAAFNAINRATLAGISLIVLGAIAAFAGAIFVGNRFILAPILAIVAVLTRWRGGEVSARTGIKDRYGEIGLVGASVDGLLDELDERRRLAQEAEETRSLMARELSHRVKNTLSVVQAIARQTFRNSSAQNAAFSQRIGALAGAYDVLLLANWESGEIAQVTRRTLAPYLAGADERISLSGPHCLLSPETVLALSLIVHELATNAAKYGALSTDVGRVNIDWTTILGRLVFTWREEKGPLVSPPAAEGFGSKLIKSAFPSNFDPQVRIDYDPEGLRFVLSFTLKPAGEHPAEAG